MATYSAITDTETSIDKPVTEPLLKKYRDNPIAQMEGDVSAPDIVHAALAGPTAGNIDLDALIPTAHSSTSYTLIETWNVYQTGTYRIRLYLYGRTANTLYARIYRNGAAYGTERSVSNADATFSQDLSFDEGDTIEIYTRNSASSAGLVAAVISVANPYHANIHCPNLLLW